MTGTQQMVVWIVFLVLFHLVALLGLAAWSRTYEDKKDADQHQV